MAEGVKSELERAFETYWRMLGNGTEPEHDVRFHPTRKWRMDFLWRFDGGGGVAVECQGATWAHGKHTRGAGYANDCEKLNEAQALGYRVIWVTRDMLDTDPEQAIGWVVDALEANDDDN